MLMSAAGDMFFALLNGAVIFSPNTKENRSGDHSNWLFQRKITVYSSVPSVFRNFVNGLRGDETFPKLRLIDLLEKPSIERTLKYTESTFPEIAFRATVCRVQKRRHSDSILSTT